MANYSDGYPLSRATLYVVMCVVLAIGILALAIPLIPPVQAAHSVPKPIAQPQPATPGINEAQLALSKSVSDEPLLGGIIGYVLAVTNIANTGDPLEDDKAYNVSITDTLPASISFTSATPPPSLIVRNPDGTTTLVWYNLTDLEQGESTSVSIQATILPTVTINDVLVNVGSATANKAPDNSAAYITATATITTYVQAIDIEKALFQSTGINQATGASGWENSAPGTGDGPQWPYYYRLTARNNNVGPTADVIVTDTLPPGVAYLGPTTIIPNPNGVPVTPTMTVLADGSLQLVWNLGTLTTNEYTNPPVIMFRVGIPYRQRVQTASPCTRIPNEASPTDPGCFDGAIIADGSTWSNSYDATGIYAGAVTGDGSTYTPDDDPLIRVTAKYQTIEKSASPSTVVYTDVATYTINYYISEYYTLTNVAITDVIPDGLLYVSGSASSAPAQVLPDTPGLGQTTLVWYIPADQTTPGRQGTITFQARVNMTYTITGDPVVAFDGLTDRVSIAGDWQDDVDPTRTGQTSDHAAASIGTRGPQIDKKVKNREGIFVDGVVTATVGDELDFQVFYTAPIRMDAKNNYLADFLPRGMSFVSQISCSYGGSISNTFTVGDTDNDPCTYYQYSLYGLNVVRWNFGFVSANMTMTAIIRARVDNTPQVADGVIVANFLKLSGNNTPGMTYSLRDDALVNYHEPHLVLSKDVQPTLVAGGGQTVTYTVHIINTGIVTAYNNIVTDTIPPYLIVDMGSCTGWPSPASCVVLSGSPHTGAGGVISWTLIASIPPSATQLLTYTAVISQGVPPGSMFRNIATVSYNSQPDNSGRQVPGTSNVADDNTDDAIVNVVPPVISKQATPNPVTIGDVVTFTLGVTVPPGTLLPTVVLTDVLSQDGFRYEGAFIQNISGAPVSPATIISTSVLNTIPSPGMTIIWGLGTIDNSTTTVLPYVFNLVFTTTVTGLNDAGTGWVNFPTASYTAPDQAILRWDGLVGTQTVGSNTTTTNVQQPLLRLTKAATPRDGVAGGDTVTFTITMTNVGSSTAYNLVLTDALPLGLIVPATGGTGSPFPATYVADSGTQAGNGGVLTFTTPFSLAVNAVQFFTFTATISNGLSAGTVFTNIADADWTSLPGTVPDARVYNDPSQESAWTVDTASAVVNMSALRTSKSASPTTSYSNTIRVGDIVTYTIINFVPANEIAYWPYQNDYMGLGFEYVPGSFTFSASPALTTTLIPNGSAPQIPANGYGIVVGGNPYGHNPNVGVRKGDTRLQALEWWMTPFVNTTAATQTITITFQAQFTGVDLVGNVIAPPPITTTTSYRNYERLYWNRIDTGVFTATGSLTTPLVNAITYIGQPNLSLGKTAFVPPAGAVVGANQLITYTLTVTNDGFAPAYNVVLTDTLPMSTSFVSAFVMTSNYPPVTPPFTTTITSLPAVGSTGVITIGLDQVLGRGNTPGVISGNNTVTKTLTLGLVVLTDGDLGAGAVLTNDAYIGYYDSQPGTGTDADGNPNTPTQRVYPATPPVSVSHDTPSPSLLKTVTPISATIGQPITYVIYLPQVPITATLYDVSFTDNVSSALRVDAVTVSGGVGAVDKTVGNNVAIVWSSIPSNTQAVITISATVLNIPSNQAGVTVANTGQFRYASIPGGPLSSPIASTANLTLLEPQVTIAKSVTAAQTPVGANDIVTYTVTLANSGLNASPAYEVIISDTLPPELSFIATTLFTVTNPVTATLGGNYPLWTVSQLNVGGVVTLSFTAQVDPEIGAGRTLTNTARATYSSMPGIVPDERPYTTTLVTAVITTAVPTGMLKAVEPITATIGQIVTYTIRVPNPPIPVMLYDVHFTDTVSDNLSVVGVNASGGLTVTDKTIGNNVHLIFGAIPSSTQAIITITTYVRDVPDNQNGTVITNSARFTYASLPGGNQNAPLTSNIVSTTVVEPRLTISKALSPTQAVANDTVTFTLWVTNTGTSTAYDVIIEDPLPSLTFTNITEGSTPVGFTFNTVPSGTLTIVRYSGAALDVGQSVTFTFTAVLSTSVMAGQVITNVATVAQYTTLPGPDPNERYEPPVSAMASLTIVAPDIAVAKSDGETIVAPGQVLTYTIWVSNTAQGNATGVMVTDTLPAHTTYVPNSASHGGVYNPSTHQITWTIGFLAAGTSVTRTFQITVDNPQPAGVAAITNTVKATDDGTHGTDPTPENNTATDIDVLDAVPDLVITKTDGDLIGIPGQNVTYTLVYTNVGNQEATNVTITETVPVSTTFNANASTPGWLCIPNGSAGSLCTLGVGSLAGNGGSGSAIFVVTLMTPLPAGFEVMTNVVRIADDGSNGPDPTPDNNTAQDTTPVEAAPDLVITKTDGGAGTTPGNVVVYTLTYTNTGNQEATGVVVTEVVPANTTFNAADSLPTMWSCADGSPAGTICTVNVGSLAGGSAGILTFAVTVNDPLPEGVKFIFNTAFIADDGSNGPDPTPDNNASTDTTPIVSAVDLRLTKVANTTTVVPGSILSYTLYYTNTGNIAATNTTITDTVPANTRFAAAASTPGWSCPDQAPAGSICTINVGTVLGRGGHGSVVFAVRVDNPYPPDTPPIVNTAVIADDGSSGPDPTPPNNSSTASTPAASPTLFTKTDWHDPVTPGWSSQRYNIVLHNSGVSTMTNVVVTDVIPVGTQYLESTTVVTSTTPPDPGPIWYGPGGSWDGAGRVVWYVGDVPPGYYASMKVRVRVYGSVAPGTTLVNTAILSASSGRALTVTETTRVIAAPTPTATPIPPTPTPTTPPTGLCPGTPALRVNAGATSPYTDTTGFVWLADQQYRAGVTEWGYIGGAVYATNTNIRGTVDPTLYQSERWWLGTGGYRFVVPNGFYQVTLKFAEIYPWAGMGSRVFTVTVEGQVLVARLDIARLVGYATAYDVQTNINVTDGLLAIDFMPGIGNPQVNALSVVRLVPCGEAPLPPTPTPTPTPTATPAGAAAQGHIRVNAGGPTYTDSSGNIWLADQTYTPGGWGAVGGFTYSTTRPIGGTDDDPLYQTERWWEGAGAYKFTIPNGTYTVTLCFAEIYPWASPGQRVFTVRIEGMTVTANLDIIPTVGYYNRYDLTIPGILVTDGVLEVNFIPVRSAPKINALHIAGP